MLEIFINLSKSANVQEKSTESKHFWNHFNLYSEAPISE